jgi:hypothetical protein
VGKFIAGVVDTVGKYVYGVVGTRGKFPTLVIDSGDVPCLVNVSVNFCKNFKMILMIFLGAWGKMIHKKI